MHLYVVLMAGVMLLALYAVLRVGICWGRHGWFWELMCHTHYLVVAAIVLNVSLLFYLFLDLGRGHHELVRTQRFARMRAAARGYRELDRGEAFHVVTSALLVMIFALLVLAAGLFSPVRF